ncbi:MAG: phosphatase PAP2 family protein [Elusimicrobiota bacterium]
MFYRQPRYFTATLRRSLSALILASGLFSAAYAEEGFYYLSPQAVSYNIPAAPAPVAVARPSSYLTQSQLQINDFPAPPAAGSAEDKADLAAVLQWQKVRTQDQCDAALAQSDESFISFFSSVTPFQKPLPAAVGTFFKRVGANATDANQYIKKIYKRDRPFLRLAALNPCLGRAQGFSYPSGHAGMSHLFGLILSDLLPRQGAIFMREADQAALNRVIGGVHHPSDVEAGKKLGDRLYKELLKNPVFVSDMQGLSAYFR